MCDLDGHSYHKTWKEINLERSQTVVFLSMGIIRCIKVDGGIGPWPRGLHTGCSSCPLLVHERFFYFLWYCDIASYRTFQAWCSWRKEGKLLWLTQQRACAFWWVLHYNSDHGRRKTSTQQLGESGSPFIPSHFELPTLKQDVFMLPGRMFHHLYSNPRAGSVPAGQALHSTGWESRERISHGQSTSQSVLKNIDITFLLSGASNEQRK